MKEERRCRCEKKISKKSVWRSGLVMVMAVALLVTCFGQTNMAKQVTTKKKEVVKGIVTVKSYKELYKYYVKNHLFSKKNDDMTCEDAKTSDMSVTAGTEAGKNGYSETNNRTEGVDEGDLIKTDGKYIYKFDSTSGNVVRIFKVDGKTAPEVATISLDKGNEQYSMYYDELILSDHILAIVGSRYEFPDDFARENDIRTWQRNESTEISLYDMTDPEKPQFLRKNTQEGLAVMARLSDGVLYTISYDNASPVILYCTMTEDKKEVSKRQSEVEDNCEDICPKANGKTIPADHVFLPRESNTLSYLVITTMNLKSLDSQPNAYAVMGDAQNMYLSKEHIYIWQTDYEYEKETDNAYSTFLMKFAYQKGNLSPVASAKLPGFLNDDYSIDEYQGALRLVSTNESNHYMFQEQEESAKVVSGSGIEEWVDLDLDRVSLYILDQKLNMTGKLENLVENENVKSVRFMGEVGYFVTFRNVDPLFSVDLSDPSSPKMMGYLKIPGFSEYLHPFGEGRLLGFGQEADINEGGRLGLKLSMFDISNPAAVKELVTKSVMQDLDSQANNIEHNGGAYSPAEYDNRAMMISMDNNLFGFQAESYYSVWNGQDYQFYSVNKYLVYGYSEEKGFYLKAEQKLDENDYMLSTRGVCIGQYLYIVTDQNVTGYSLAE